MGIVDIISGFVVGLALGWALQRGGFCMNTAFRSIAFKEDRSTLRAWILVLLINVPGLILLETLGVVFPARAPFTPLSLIAGGLLFGAGMVWAGGCVSGSYYRASKGMLGSFIALIGFAGGAMSMSRGALGHLRGILNRVEWTVAGEVPTLGHVLPNDPWTGRWVAVAVISLLAIAYLVRSPKTRFAVGWKWPLTGAVVGVLALAAWYFSSLSARDYGLSLVQPTVALGTWVLSGDASGLNWTGWMLLALPPGAFLAALKGRDLGLRAPEPRRMLIQFAGGLAMGAGASLAGGCNIGHGITGISTLALSSVAATVFTILGNWGATALVWRAARRSIRLDGGA